MVVTTSAISARVLSNGSICITTAAIGMRRYSGVRGGYELFDDASKKTTCARGNALLDRGGEHTETCLCARANISEPSHHTGRPLRAWRTNGLDGTHSCGKAGRCFQEAGGGGKSRRRCRFSGSANGFTGRPRRLYTDFRVRRPDEHQSSFAQGGSWLRSSRGLHSGRLRRKLAESDSGKSILSCKDRSRTYRHGKSTAGETQYRNDPRFRSRHDEQAVPLSGRHRLS